MNNQPALLKQLNKLSLYGFICLLIASIGCLFLSIVFRDVADIRLTTTNEPPYEWRYIYAGIYNFICFVVGLIGAFISLKQINLIIPIISSLFMISGAMLEFVLLLDWSINVIIIIFCALYLIVAPRVSLLKGQTIDIPYRISLE